MYVYMENMGMKISLYIYGKYGFEKRGIYKVYTWKIWILKNEEYPDDHPVYPDLSIPRKCLVCLPYENQF